MENNEMKNQKRSKRGIKKRNSQSKTVKSTTKKNPEQYCKMLKDMFKCIASWIILESLGRK